MSYLKTILVASARNGGKDVTTKVIYVTSLTVTEKVH
jgi:hypothetical protein